MKKIIIILSLLTLNACATANGYKKTMDSWIGSSESQLISRWGTPHRTYESDNGDKLLTYTRNRSVYMPSNYNTNFYGNSMYTTGYGGYNVNYNCETTFTINPSNIISNISWRGNDCKAKTPKNNKDSSPVNIGVFSDWQTYQINEKSGKACYMSAFPKTGDMMTTIMLTHRPPVSKNTFSFKSTKKLKENGVATLKVDNKEWELFIKEGTAWAKDNKTDNEIASFLKKGNSMSIEGQLSNGGFVKSYFSLNGSSKAYDRISEACEVK